MVRRMSTIRELVSLLVGKEVKGMITLEQAKKALEASEKKAREIGIAVTTVIVDEHGSIIAVSRMDGAYFISPEFAYAKAYTAAMLKIPTGDLEPYAEQGKPYYGITSMFGGKLTVVAGGIPVMISGKIAGAVGVGGSANPQQDLQCAQEAVKTMRS